MSIKTDEYEVIRLNSADQEESSNSPNSGRAVPDFFATDEIFQRVAASAHEEFSLPARLLFFGGLAAGLSIGLSFIARAALTGIVTTDSTGLIGNLLYPIGFVLIVLGRYQLFTENTLTPVTLVLTRIASIPLLLRNWGLVLFANVLGATIIAFMLSSTNVLDPPARDSAVKIGLHALSYSPATLFSKAVIAGWLVASMVWLVHAARDTISRFFIIWFIMYLVPSAELFHCIVGACEALFLVFEGEATLYAAVIEFFLPVVAGNTVGGVLLVAILNFAQTHEVRFAGHDVDGLQLNWQQWLFGFHSGVTRQ